MKLNIQLLIIAFALVSFNICNAQTLVEDGKISVTPAWEMGETATYDYTSISYFKEKGDEKENDTLDMELEITVAEVLDTNFIMQAKYSLKNTEAETHDEKLRKDIFHGTKVFYTTKKDGGYEDLTSMNLLISVVRYAMEKNWKMFQENAANPRQKPTKDQIMKELDRIFAQNAEGFIKHQVGIGEEFRYLHSFYGDKLNMEDTTMFFRTIKEPFAEEGEEPKEHQIASVATINKLDSDEGIIDVSVKLETNGQEGFVIGFDFFSAIEKEIKDMDDVPETSITLNMRYVVDLASGWVKEMEYVREVSSEKATLLDKKILKMQE